MSHHIMSNYIMSICRVAHQVSRALERELPQVLDVAEELRRIGKTSRHIVEQLTLEASKVRRGQGKMRGEA